MLVQFHTASALKNVLGQKTSASVETHSIILFYVLAARSVTKKGLILIHLKTFRETLMTIIIFQKLFLAMFSGMKEPLEYSQKSGH